MIVVQPRRAFAATLLLCACAPWAAQAGSADLFISEYVEGTIGSNKAIEIFNPTTSSVDLAAGGYKLRRFSNGGTSPADITLSGTIAPGDVFVVASNTFVGTADLLNSGISHNGDDGYTLVKGGAANTLVDAFGRSGEDPGTNWGSGASSTVDNTLRRKPDVCAGDTDFSNAFDPSIEWNGFGDNVLTDLGSHTSTCVDLAPAISDTLPVDDAINVAIDSNIDIGFTEEVTIANPADAFSLECPAATPIAFSVSASPAIAYTLNPNTDLPNGTVCTVTVTSAEVFDTDELPTVMAADFSFNFTTIPADPVVTFSSATSSLAEFDSGVETMRFSLEIIPAPTDPISFNATVTGSGGNPANGADFGVGANFGNPVMVTFDGASSTPYSIEIPINGDTDPEGNQTFTLTLNGFSGTDPLQVSPITATGTILDDDFAITAIHAIQGAGSASPLAEDAPVKVVGAVVTAVTLSPPAAANGFFMQSKDVDADANDLTSQGIFVFTGGAPSVSVGDEVRVAGQVTEFFSQTQLDNVVSVTVTASGLALPSAVEFSPSTGIPSTNPAQLSCPGTGPGGTNNVDTNFECYEGMRISIPNGLVSTGNLRRAADLYAEAYITTTGNRSRREEGLLFGLSTTAGNAASPLADGNPEVIEIDADEAGLGVTELTAGSTFSATGVIGYSFGDYEFYPTTYAPIVTAAVPEAVMAPAGGDELTVASFNTQHLCDDNFADGCDRDTLGATGALNYANKLGKVAAYVRTVLNLPDVIGFQEVDSVTTLQDLATRIAADTAGAAQYSAFLVEGDDPGGIDVGFLTRNGRVQNVSVEQFYKGDLWNDPNDPDILHDRPPLLLRAEFVGDGVGGTHPFAVMNNHTKARSLVDNGDAASERDRAKRFYQARDIADLVQQFQTATGPFAGDGTDTVPLILVGDYNAFEYTDGYVDVVGLIAGTYDDAANECTTVLSEGAGTETCNLGANIVDPPLFNTGLAVPANERISYEFTQNYGIVQGANTRDVASVQVIDHILLARTAQGFFLSTDFGVANNAAGVNSGRTDTGPINSSDHDGMVTYLDFDCLNSAELNPDGDLVCGMLDNCPNVSNNDQTDTDANGVGDACQLGDFIFGSGFEDPPASGR